MGNQKKKSAKAQGKAAQEQRKRILYIAGAAVVVCLLVIGLLMGGGSQEKNGDVKISLDAYLVYYADIVIRDYGTVTVKLDQSQAPITCDNFVKLAESGFYDGLTFHRIMDGFMMQGGDPKADGTGGSGEKIVGEFIKNGYNNTLSHTRGAISMARARDYNSASSQFFIVQQDSVTLDRLYAVGETACNGVHGKNRLASNSLLESLVFAKRAAEDLMAGYEKVSERVAFSVDVSDYKDYQRDYKKAVLAAIERERKSHE